MARGGLPAGKQLFSYFKPLKHRHAPLNDGDGDDCGRDDCGDCGDCDDDDDDDDDLVCSCFTS